MGVVDSSTLLDLFDAQSPGHAKAKARLAKGTFTVTPGVLSEVTQAVRRRAAMQGLDGAKAARDMLAALRSLPGYTFAAQADDAGIAKIYASDAGLSYVDAWGVWLARKSGEDLWTHDAAQARAWRRLR